MRPSIIGAILMWVVFALPRISKTRLEFQVLLHDMKPRLALEMGTSLQSRQGLQRLATRTGDVDELARWLRTDEAKALEQKELDPKAPRELSPSS